MRIQPVDRRDPSDPLNNQALMFGRVRMTVDPPANLRLIGFAFGVVLLDALGETLLRHRLAFDPMFETFSCCHIANVNGLWPLVKP